MAPYTQFFKAAQALPFWREMPFRYVEVRFPDGSWFQLRAHDLAVRAAQALQLPGQEPMAHLLEQVLPLVRDEPEFLMELASRLTWPEAQALAHLACWRTPCQELAEQFNTQTKMRLS